MAITYCFFQKGYYTVHVLQSDLIKDVFVMVHTILKRSWIIVQCSRLESPWTQLRSLKSTWFLYCVLKNPWNSLLCLLHIIFLWKYHKSSKPPLSNKPCNKHPPFSGKKVNEPPPSTPPIDGFHSDIIKLLSQNSKVLRILIYTRLKINKK